MAALQLAHSATRYNEAMSQASADKQLQFINQNNDRWQLQLQQLIRAGQ
jgi:hypothetical protein